MIAKRLSFLLGLALLTTPAWAYRFLRVEYPEAIKKVQTWINDHPNDAAGYFVMGGLEGFAYAQDIQKPEAKELLDHAGNSDLPPAFPPWVSIRFNRDNNLPVTPENLTHLKAAITNYRKAVGIDPKNPRYQLALAWALEEAGKNKLDLTGLEVPRKLTAAEQASCQAALAQLGNTDVSRRVEASKTLTALMPHDFQLLHEVHTDDLEVQTRIGGIIKSYWENLALAHYRIAYQGSYEQDVKAGMYNREADWTVSVPAGQRILALHQPDDAATAEETKQITEVIKIISSKPMPLIIDY